MPSLYVISPPQIHLNEFAKTLDEILNVGDIGAFQLRLKNINILEVKKAVETLLPICHRYGTPFFINDFYELARDYEIDGIHIGQNDGNAKKLKTEFCTEKIIGVSCQNSKHLAMVAGENGADYVSFGAFFHTDTKKDAIPANLKILEWCKKYTTLPCAAIGGINHDNISNIIKANADFICIISAIWNYPEGPRKSVEKFNTILNS